jgi:hypothetical protein
MTARKAPLPLDATLFDLDDKHLKFFRSLTGITNDEEVKQHIMTIQARAYEVTRFALLAKYHWMVYSTILS